MVSPQLIRRFPFFSGLSTANIAALADAGELLSVQEGHLFFEEQDTIRNFYINLEGAVGLFMGVPAAGVTHSLAAQLTGELETEDTVLSAVGPGEVFGWSALVPPHEAMAGAKTLTSCRTVAFDCTKLTKSFEEDCDFGYVMMQKIANVMRGRLRDKRIESLSVTMASSEEFLMPIP
ncbi:MAG: Crp/Fnr family transcriptional regulator [Chloroflexi bacterium]|nr:Crp/Fnr family transcriptional regulator [Chloroflexota bacterium]